jgi:hypothetical protein
MPAVLTEIRYLYKYTDSYEFGYFHNLLLYMTMRRQYTRFPYSHGFKKRGHLSSPSEYITRDKNGRDTVYSDHNHRYYSTDCRGPQQRFKEYSKGP